ncbi:unnamed protein product, partial [Prorocentrum cordatum]
TAARAHAQARALRPPPQGKRKEISTTMGTDKQALDKRQKAMVKAESDSDDDESGSSYSYTSEEQAAAGAAPSNPATTKLGELVNVLAILQGWKAADHAWLKHWDTPLKECIKNLMIYEKVLKEMVQGGSSKEFPKACTAIEDATKLHGNLVPIMQSVAAALESAKKK